MAPDEPEQGLLVADEVPTYLRYFACLMALDRRGAVTVVEDFLAAGHSVIDLYIDVLDPCLVHVGCEWEAGRITVAHEHYLSEVTRDLIYRYGPTAWADPEPASPVVLACGVPGEHHTIGLSMVADVLRAAGLIVHTLGIGLPAASTVTFAREVRANFLFLSCALDVHLPDALDLVAHCKAEIPSLRVVLGGAAVRHLDEPAVRALGVDHSAANLRRLRDSLPGWLQPQPPAEPANPDADANPGNGPCG